MTTRYGELGDGVSGDAGDPDDYRPAFKRVALPPGDLPGVTAWDFEVGHGQFRAVRDSTRPRGHDWFLGRRHADSGEWFTAIPDLPSREACLVEAETLIELEEWSAVRRRRTADPPLSAIRRRQVSPCCEAVCSVSRDDLAFAGVPVCPTCGRSRDVHPFEAARPAAAVSALPECPVHGGADDDYAFGCDGCRLARANRL